MRPLPDRVRPILMFPLALILLVGAASIAGAQSQEPKPVLPATPVADSDLPPSDGASTGVTDSSWRGPNWGVSVNWDPSVWSVEAEFIDENYDGLQIGTPLSTVYIEAYERFAGDPAACLTDAEAEIAAREGVSEVAPLSGRPLPVPDDVRGDAQLYGLILTLPDGTVLRGVEYVECRTVAPGVAVLEITWQTVTGAFNEDFPRVETLLAAIELPGVSGPEGTPSAALATPVA